MTIKKNIQNNESEPVANHNQLPSESLIEPKIIEVRAKQVILDNNLAEMYGVETKVLNQAVKRNIKRFPDDFMFQLTKDEFDDLRLRSQFVTSNIDDNLKSQYAISSRGGVRYLPYAFTEQGISMLSSVLHSDIAIEVNIKIMRAFVAMRHFLVSNAQVFQRLDRIELKQLDTDKRIEDVFKRFDECSVEPKHGIFFDGQIFDAYVFVCDLVKEAKQRILLIDNYVDERVLTILDKRASGVDATIYSQKFTKLDIDKHNEQYPPINTMKLEETHDRFLVIDDKVYHFGSSFKDLGNKWFAVMLMDKTDGNALLKRLK